jgi:hypothetical protein
MKTKDAFSARNVMIFWSPAPDFDQRLFICPDWIEGDLTKERQVLSSAHTNFITQQGDYIATAIRNHDNWLVHISTSPLHRIPFVSPDTAKDASHIAFSLFPILERHSEIICSTLLES